MKQTDQNGKSKEEHFTQILKDLERAKPNPNLFAKIENEIADETIIYSQKITPFQLRFASAAAVLLIITNSFLIFGLNKNTNNLVQDPQNRNTIELISDFTIYE